MEAYSCLLALQHLEYTKNIVNALGKYCLKPCMKMSFYCIM